MSFFIADAVAAASSSAPAAAPGESMFPMFMLLAIFVLFYFMLIRPQNKRAKEHQKLISELRKGDEVITNGGFLGKIVKIDDQYIKVALADSIEVTIQRNAISSVLPKGTLKSI
ncbi:preprotein translocase subunit YajC [Legionella sp. W05-934-2]|jgi:preprotein translocase subunit YajC|uniref:preprotein translocase subunit YajC n=1 Tax=Legionella sp. W05-934-2 TaxID=1198649 RepID=UPI0034620B11